MKKLAALFFMLSVFCSQALFTDDKEMDLIDLVDFAFHHNPTIQVAWANARLSESIYEKGKSAYYPALSLSAEATRTRSPKIPLSGTPTTFRASYRPAFSLSYILYDFGARGAAVKEAYESLSAADALYKWTLQGVLQKVINAYFHYQASLSSLEAKEADLKDAQESLKSSEEREKAGITTIADVLQAKSRYAKAKMSLASAQGLVFTLKGVLASSIGLSAATDLNLAPPEFELKVQDTLDDLDALIVLAKKERGDLNAAQSQVKLTEASLDLAGASGLGSFNFNLSGGENYFQKSQQSGTEGYDMSGTLSFSIPLFRGFYDKESVRAARYAVDGAGASYRHAVQKVTLEVLTDYYGLETAAKNLTFSDEFLSYTTQNYEVASHNYKAGTGDILDLLSALTLLAEAREKRVEAKVNWNTSLVNLAYTVGVLSPPSKEGYIDELSTTS